MESPSSVSPSSRALSASAYNARANFLSRWMRATTVFLYSRVKAMLFFFLRLLVSLPARNRGGDVRFLPPFASAAKQDDDHLPIAPKINAVARPEIQSQLGHAFAQNFGGAEIS